MHELPEFCVSLDPSGRAPPEHQERFANSTSLDPATAAINGLSNARFRDSQQITKQAGHFPRPLLL